MTAPPSAPAVVLGRGAVSPAVAGALGRGALVSAPEVALLDVIGPGAVACMQGLLTNDVEAPGDGGFTYGAVLTPKGMIVSDLWAERDRAAMRLTVPRAGLEALLDVFRRSLPPRLARVTEPEPPLAVVHLAGPRALDVAAGAGCAIPPEGRRDGAAARPAAGAPFRVQLVVARPRMADLLGRLTAAGALNDAGPGLELARVVAGWPRLGAEIDERTLPQEVRYDEIGGVSYTKGCYTGQETVARVHFRGHPNRVLHGLIWRDEPDPTRTDVEQAGQSRGRVSSMVWLPSDRVVGLGILRREVEPGSTVRAAGADAQVVRLPLDSAGPVP